VAPFRASAVSSEHLLDRGRPHEDRLRHRRRHREPVLTNGAEQILDLMRGVADRRAADRVGGALQRVHGPEDGRQRLLIPRAALDGQQSGGHRLEVLGGLGQEILQHLVAVGEEAVERGGDRRPNWGGPRRRSRRHRADRPRGGGSGREKRRVAGLELTNPGRVLHPDRADSVEDFLQKPHQTAQEPGRPRSLLRGSGGRALEQSLGGAGEIRHAREAVERRGPLQTMREHPERRQGRGRRSLGTGQLIQAFLESPGSIPGLHEEDPQHQLALTSLRHAGPQLPSLKRESLTVSSSASRASCSTLLRLC